MNKIPLAEAILLGFQVWSDKDELHRIYSGGPRGDTNSVVKELKGDLAVEQLLVFWVRSGCQHCIQP